MTYVFDDRAVAEVFVLRPVRPLIDHLTDLVEQGELTFSNDVLAEMKDRYEAGDHCLTWAIAVRKSRHGPAVPWADKQDVLDTYPAMVDVNTPNDPCGPSVLAQARSISEYMSVTVVTEDWGEKPGRMTLAAACISDGMPCISAIDFLGHLGF